MKKNYIYKIAAAVLSAGMMLIACERPEPDQPDDPNNGGVGVKPIFPDLVENYEVKPGETLELTFTPNMDWEVSVPSEGRQWFWIADGSFKRTDFKGKASESPVTVKIGVTETNEFDKSYSCEVTMKMGEESKVIARYMLPAKERTLEIYAAEWAETDSLNVVDGSYVYSAEPVETIELAWSAADADFRAPVRIESNCEWEVEYPEWAYTNVPVFTTGIVEIVFTGLSLEDATGNIVFKAGDSVLKEVAVSIPSCSDINVYSAVVADGEFEYGEDGEYAWTSEPVDAVTLAWLGSDFRMPVKVDSKCEWTVETPEWIDVNVPDKTSGSVTLNLIGNPSKYPLDDTEGKILFKYEDTVISELKVNIPGCRNIHSHSIDMSLTELDFSYVGQIRTSAGYIDGPVTASIFGTSEASVFAVENVGGKYVVDAVADPDWIKISMSNYNTADGADVLQDRDVKISVSENGGDERSAMLFFLPTSYWGNLSALFTEGAAEVKEEYLPCAVLVRQYSNDTEYLTPSSTADAMAEAGASFAAASEEKKAELTAAFGQTKYVYTLAYDNIYARDEAFFTMARPFTSVRIFDNVKEDMTYEDLYWLKYVSASDNNNFGVIDMYNGEEFDLPEEPQTGYVVFYDSTGGVLAIVECISPEAEEVVEPPVVEPGDGTVKDEYGNVFVSTEEYFVDPSAAKAAGAAMYMVSSGPYYDQYKEVGCPIIMLEYTSADTELEIKVPAAVSWFQVMMYSFSDYVTVNGLLVSETSGIIGKSVETVKVKMKPEVATNKDSIEKNNGVKLLLHKNMSTQDPTIVIFCRLNVSE